MSETYRALTRAYRPASFEDIVSQQHVSGTLMNAMKQNRLAHAYMFCGPRGVGKTTMARVLARTLNEVDSSVDGEALNQTLNIVEIDAASHNKVEDIHHLRESVRIPPQNGRYKIFIIDEVHMLSKAAFNALLKTLEEPPAHAIFIFATTEPHKVLPTILSRVQRFDFRRISTDEIRDQLKKIATKEQISIDDESLLLIARRADGALRDALGLMDQAIAFCGREITYKSLLEALHAVDIDQLFTFTDIVLQREALPGLELLDTLLREGADMQEFLGSLNEHFRNLYVASVSSGNHLIEATEETKARYKAQVKAFTPEDILRCMHLVSECQVKIREARQPRIQLEIMLLKLIHMTPAAELAQIRHWLSDEHAGSTQTETGSAQPHETDGSAEEVKKKDLNPVAESDSESAPVISPPPSPVILKTSPNPLTLLGKPSLSSSVVLDDSAKTDAVRITSDRAGGSHTASHTPDEISDASESTNTIESSDILVSESPEVSKPLSLELFEEIWPAFLTALQEKAPKFLVLQMERVLLKAFDKQLLIVAVDNEFGSRMVEEYGALFSDLLKELTGNRMRIKSVIEQSAIPKTDQTDPYQLFMEAQKNDPVLRQIVEKFGAELQYT